MTATDHRMQVLEMLKSGTITVEQAEALLDRLNSAAPADSAAAGAARPEAGTNRPRYLRVQVESDDGDRVNVRLPMALVRTGIKLSTLIPKEARESVQEQGIDLDVLASMDPDELVRALSELTVDVESSGGDKVRVYCE